MDSHRPGVTSFVHVGLVVEDLDETVRFLALLGFDCGEPGVFSGEWIDRIIGLEGVTVETVMARAPDGSDMFEVVRFHSPSAGAQEPAPAANRPGLRHVAFKVDDVRGVVERVREAGWDTVGEIVDFENTFLLCYVRGPEGLIVELAERLDGANDSGGAVAADPGRVTISTLERLLDAFNAHDIDAVMSFFADDCVLEMPRGPDPWGRRLEGRERVRDGLASRFAGIPDVHYGDDRHWLAGDRGCSEWLLTGTSAEGERIAVRGCDLFEFSDGRIVRKDSYWKIVEG